jgi:uncharacterized membrane protein
MTAKKEGDAAKSRGRNLDLLVIFGITAVGIFAVFMPYLNETLFRSIIGLIFVIVVPGYSLVAALFPRKDDISGIERAALSLALSIVIVPLVGVILSFTPWGIRVEPIVGTLVLLASACLLIALYRRKTISPDKRFSVRFDRKITNKIAAWRLYNRSDQLLIAVLIIVAVWSSCVLAAVVYKS